MARAHIRSGLVACLLLMLPGGSRAEVWTQDTYRNTLYYRTTFAADSSASGLLHIAAVDSFAVYFNGVAIGANSSWNQVRTYPVDVLSGDNALAVEVVNRGLGVGHGLLAVIAVDSLRYGETDPKAQTWYWTARPDDTDWQVADIAEQPGWQVVQAGSVNRALIEGLPDPAPDLVAGFPGGTDIGGVVGGVVLKQIRGENLALGRPSNRIEAVDGDLRTAWEPPVSSVNFAASIDLQQRRLIRAVLGAHRGPRLRPEFPPRLFRASQRQRNPLVRGGGFARYRPVRAHRSGLQSDLDPVRAHCHHRRQWREPAQGRRDPGLWRGFCRGGRFSLRTAGSGSTGQAQEFRPHRLECRHSPAHGPVGPVSQRRCRGRFCRSPGGLERSAGRGRNPLPGSRTWAVFAVPRQYGEPGPGEKSALSRPERRVLYRGYSCVHGPGSRRAQPGADGRGYQLCLYPRRGDRRWRSGGQKCANSRARTGPARPRY